MPNVLSYFAFIIAKKSYRLFAEILLGAFILLWVAIYNGFPLVTQDSGAYLNSAFSSFFPSDRPVFYAFFLRLFGARTSLFLPVIFQAIIVSSSMVLFIRLCFKNCKWWLSIIIIILCSILTPVSFFVSQLSADFSVAPMFLLVAVYLFSKDRAHQIVSLFIALALSVMHNSNVLVLILLVFFTILFVLKTREYKRLIFLMILTVVSVLSVAFSNLHYQGKFTLSKVGHVFLMGKMVESGVLKIVLNEECSVSPYKLCQYKDSLPRFASDFIWNPKSPFYKTGGWHDTKEEYNDIILKSLTSPRYLKLHFVDAFSSTIKQLPLVGVDDVLSPFNSGSNPSKVIQAHDLDFYESFSKSKQQKDKLKKVFKGNIYSVFLSMALLIIVVMMVLAIFKQGRKLYPSIKVVLLLVLLNAIVTAVLANVTARLNARCIWLVVFLCIITTLQFWVDKKSKILGLEPS